MKSIYFVLTFLSFNLICLKNINCLYVDKDNLVDNNIIIDNFKQEIIQGEEIILERQRRSISNGNDNILLRKDIITKINALNDSHPQLMVNWVGAKSSVMICLARDGPYSKDQPLPSALYFSYDYGTTFENKTNVFTVKLSNQTIQAVVEKFYYHPIFSSYCVFVDFRNKLIFTSSDHGHNINWHKLNFTPNEIASLTTDPLTFYVLDRYDPMKRLWITRDFGRSFSVVEKMVKRFYLLKNGTILFQRIEPKASTIISKTISADDPSTIKTYELLKNVEDFELKNEYIFATVNGTGKQVDLYIKYKNNEFKKATFNNELERKDYFIADVTDNRLFVAIFHTAQVAHLYVSDTDKYEFILSLNKIVCYFPNNTIWKDAHLGDLTDEAFADLHKVDGIKGIYIASQFNPRSDLNYVGPEHLITVITFDWGRTWQRIKAPLYDSDNQKIICKAAEDCSLHLSQKFAQLYPITRSVPIMSTKSAPGILISTGTIGKSLKGFPGVFISRDAGLTWKQIFKDLHFYNIGDHGGVIVAVKYYKAHGETRQLYYSTDEGETWNHHDFLNTDIKIYGLMTEPGENTTVFTMFGSNTHEHQWLIVKVDLANVFEHNCSKDDYKYWSPTGKTGCILGKREIYQRRVHGAKCMNGLDYERPVSSELCECSIEHFECDSGFFKEADSLRCIRNKTILRDPYNVPSNCKSGEYYNRTKGYRRIPDDVCFGGDIDNFLPETVPCPSKESSRFLLLAQKNRIVKFDLETQKSETVPVKNIENVISVEYDLHNNCVYWADVVNDIISRQCLVNGSFVEEKVVVTALLSVEGMSLDWVSNLLFWVDAQKALIQVIRTDIKLAGRMRKTILDSKVLNKPRGIAVHPKRGLMFWTDWAAGNASVSSANSDGSNVKRLFGNTVVTWPNGITIDFIVDRIYWVDAKEDYIASSNVDGTHFKKIIHSDERVGHPFAVGVFKDFIYWDDWKANAVFMADKDTGHGITTLMDQLPGLMDLKIFALQEGTNKCANKSLCPYLCFPKANDGYTCACPDDMFELQGECYCSANIKPFANGTCPQDGSTCTNNQFTCQNGSCIAANWRCDADNDCEDGSDEKDCFSETCPANAFQCNNGSCIPQSWKCDSQRDCFNGEDELDCVYVNCTSKQFKCKNGRCISEKWICDKQDDCNDGSDEANCPTPMSTNTCDPEEFRCENGYPECIPNQWRCDGESDCLDHSDEKDCSTNKCESWQFQCELSKRCIYQSWVCDGEFDCKQANDTSDEKNCSKSTTVAPIEVSSYAPLCHNWMFKCLSGKCIPSEWKCDGVDDCEDFSDELGCDAKSANSETVVPINNLPQTTPPGYGCSRFEFRCNSGACIKQGALCDGFYDCEGGEDENLNCNLRIVCTEEQFKCRTTGNCISLSMLCDGISQCPDDSDETSCTPPSLAEPSCALGYFPCDMSRCFPLNLMCNGKQECFDGIDEANCTSDNNQTYQIGKLGLENKVDETGLSIHWWRLDNKHNEFEYMPSICEIETNNWINASWARTNDFKFMNLKPYTKYNMTVYVRKINSKKIDPPSTYIQARTAEGVPSPPWNVTLSLISSTKLRVKWAKPVHPNGVIQEYTIYLLPPLPPLEFTVDPGKTEAIIEYPQFTPLENYSVWMTASSSSFKSHTSNTVALVIEKTVFVDGVSNLEASSISPSEVMLKWDKVDDAEGYHVASHTTPPYPMFPTLTTKENAISIRNLSPKTTYMFQVNAFKKSFTGRSSMITITTTGVPLPSITELHGELAKAEGTTVKLSWDAPKDNNRKIKWIYGLYYATSVKDLFLGHKISTDKLTYTVRDLGACESYMFSVGIIGPIGLGILSPPLNIETEFNNRAPPKNINVLTPNKEDETNVTVRWSSSCPFMRSQVGYIISINEVTRGQETRIKIDPSNSTELGHTIQVEYGGIYNITMMVDTKYAYPSEAYVFYAPPLPPPHQIMVFPEKNGSYIVYWREVELPTKLKEIPFKYSVLINEGKDMDVTKAKEYFVNAPPFIVSSVEDGKTYCFAIQLVTSRGFRSALSEIYTYEMPAGSWAQVLTDTSIMSFTIPSFLLIFSLCGALAYYVIRHRRLQQSFSQFANSHYDTRSGSATFCGVDGLDDDEPVIRGFSDDEPLVIA